MVPVTSIAILFRGKTKSEPLTCVNRSIVITLQLYEVKKSEFINRVAHMKGSKMLARNSESTVY